MPSPHLVQPRNAGPVVRDVHLPHDLEGCGVHKREQSAAVGHNEVLPVGGEPPAVCEARVKGAYLRGRAAAYGENAL